MNEGRLVVVQDVGKTVLIQFTGRDPFSNIFQAEILRFSPNGKFVQFRYVPDGIAKWEPLQAIEILDELLTAEENSKLATEVGKCW